MDVYKRASAVKNIARRKGHSKESAEDLSQHTALTYLRLNNYTQTNYQSYVDALRTCNEAPHTRAGILQRPLPLANVEKLLAGQYSEDYIYDEIENKKDLDLVAKAMHSLPSKLQKIIILYLFYDWTFLEIAKHQGIAESTAYKLYKRGLNKLKQIIKPNLVR